MSAGRDWYERLEHLLDQLSRAQVQQQVERLTDEIYLIVQEVEPESPVSQTVAVDTTVMTLARSPNPQNFDILLERLEDDSLLKRQMAPAQICIRIDGCFLMNGQLWAWWKCCDATGSCRYYRWQC